MAKLSATTSATTKIRSTGANLLPHNRRDGSVYARLREELRSSVIEPGQPGDRVPSERQLALQFGVSPLTVSRAMQELQSEGAVERIVGKGTFISKRPAPQAKSVRQGHATATSADAAMANSWDWNSSANRVDAEAKAPAPYVAPYVWIVASLGGANDGSHAREYWSHRLASHVERWAQKSGGRTVVTNQETIAAAEVAALAERMVDQGVNSVVFLVDGPQETTKTWMHQLLRLQAQATHRLCMTQVSFGNGNRFPLDTVRFNGEQGAFLATTHLLHLGHREIAFLAPAPALPWVADRISGFERALEMATLEVTPDRVFCAAPAPSEREPWSFVGQNAGARLLDGNLLDGKRFSAVVAANDAIARAFVEMAGERGLQVPEDVSVVGFDDWHYSSTLGLTTIHPPIELMGEVAASLALKRLSQPFDGGHVEVVLDPTLVVRSSTRAF